MPKQPTARARIERAMHVSFKLPEQVDELLNAYRDQVLTEAAAMLRGAWAVAEGALERDSLLGDDTALAGDVVEWAATELDRAARTSQEN